MKNPNTAAKCLWFFANKGLPQLTLWRGQFFVDLALPLGLCSAPYIFNSVAAMVEVIFQKRVRVFYRGFQTQEKLRVFHN